MGKKEDKRQGEERVELTEVNLDSVSGGKDYKIHEKIYKDLDGNIVKVEKTTTTYSNSGKFLNEKTEVIYY